MRISVTLAGALLSLALGAPAAGSAGFELSPRGEGRMRWGAGEQVTLPPIGFVKFCGRNPLDCRPAPGPARKAIMSGERWRALYRLNSYVNARIRPASDKTLYGEDEYWTYPGEAGDCEDYVLLKKRYLEKMGFPRSALLITVVLDEADEGHAVLMLRSEDGDFVLDNRRSDILRARETDYTFLKRQSDHDPRDWVSLTGDIPGHPRLLASGRPADTPEGTVP